MLKKLLLSLLLFVLPVRSETVDVVYFIDNRLNTENVVAKLDNYTAILNYILSKNTNKQFRNAGVYLKSGRFWSEGVTSLPRYNYQVWVDLDYTDYPFTHNGYLSWDQSGAAVLADIKCPTIYDPFNTSNIRDFWQQITTILHEYAHVFGGGIGEYYSLINVPDRTGVFPTHNLSMYNTLDTYWGNKYDFIYDPLTWNVYGKSVVGSPTTLFGVLVNTRYSNLTAAQINFNYRYPFVNPAAASKFVININKVANIKVWSVDQYSSNLLVDIDSNTLTYTWGDTLFGSELLKLIKITDGAITRSLYISLFDLQIAALSGYTSCTVSISF